MSDLLSFADLKELCQTLLTYKEAKRLASRKNPNAVFRSDAGDGWTSEVYWCSRRKRQVWTSISPDGIRVV